LHSLLHYFKKPSFDVFRQDDGQALVEYGLIIGLVSLAGFAGLLILAGGIDGLYDMVNAVYDALVGSSI
jgi:Flp pilus assembly pilin Flp